MKEMLRLVFVSVFAAIFDIAWVRRFSWDLKERHPSELRMWIFFIVLVIEIFSICCFFDLLLGV